MLSIFNSDLDSFILITKYILAVFRVVKKVCVWSGENNMDQSMYSLSVGITASDKYTVVKDICKIVYQWNLIYFRCSFVFSVPLKSVPRCYESSSK